MSAHRERLGLVDPSRLLVLVIFGVTLACTGWARSTAAQTPPGSDDWSRLQRPLHLPSLAPGSPCPRTGGERVSPDLGFVLGSGPAYPAGLGPDGVFNYGGARVEGGWYYQKVLWFARPSYRGPLLIRGHQLDGAHLVRFGTGPFPDDQLRLPAADAGTAPDWHAWPSYTRVQAAGCYAYQIDGTTFSEVIVFQAVRERPADLTPVPALGSLPRELSVTSALPLGASRVRLALSGADRLEVRVDVAPSQAAPLALQGPGVQQLATPVGPVLWRPDPRLGGPGIAVWDDGPRRYQLDVLDGQAGAWTVADLRALIAAFAAAPGAATPVPPSGATPA